MTLIVALANQKHAILLADRRITRDGTVVDDEFNKVCILCYEDARVSMAYTGIATYPGFNTSDWILETLNEIGGTNDNLNDILNELSIRATYHFKNSPYPDHKLSILVCGFGYWNQSPEPVAYVISNFEHNQDVASNFTLRRIYAENGIIVETVGAASRFTKQAAPKLKTYLSKELQPSNILRAAVKQLQIHAGGVNELSTIGKQCNSAIIEW